MLSVQHVYITQTLILVDIDVLCKTLHHIDTNH